jgi:hypothetical protein
MPSTLDRLRELQTEIRAHLPALMSVTPDPHAELMAMVWGSRFDRQHALDLWARLPSATAITAKAAWHTLSALADQFDGMAAAHQHSLRRSILRHRAISRVAS